MKVFDGLTSLFRESDEDDYIEEDGYLEEEFDREEEPGSSERRFTERGTSAKTRHTGEKRGLFNPFKKSKTRELNDDYSEDDFDDRSYDYDDTDDDDISDFEYERSYEKKTAEVQPERSYTRQVSQPRTETKNVVPLRAAGGSKKMEVVVIRPNSMEDGSEITDTLLSGRAVVLNLEGISPDIAQHIIDYTAGSCYAMRGNLQKITNYIFLVTPSSVTISGDFQDVLGSGVDLGSLNGNFQF